MADNVSTKLPPLKLLPFEGRWFIFRDERGRTKYQGVVHSIIRSSQPPGDLVLVQYAEWLMGEMNTMSLVPLVSMIGDGGIGPGYCFFKDDEYLRFYMEHHQRYRDERIDAESKNK